MNAHSFNRWNLRPILAIFISGLLGSVFVIADDQPRKFAEDVQPLLAKHCLLCHGPDDAQGGLQLHAPETALAELDSGARAIVPGDASHSELLRRITTDDPDLQMPTEGERLSPAEIATLRDWIEDGAEWEVHWAYRPLDAGQPPAVENSVAIRNDVDRFVVARLERASIAPSTTADRATLIKRLYYDLIGLPPEPAEVDAFLRDDAKDAYEKLVDRLLASQHFGERWGRHWLDKARYADSDGYEKDRHRPDAWRYRDWVIRAINEDKPFDRFTVEQLAGDMLPDASPLQLLATAFHRQTLTNTEGGVDKEQFRVAAVMDRTETLGAVWLGLSVGCARCHNHKYDQISQREYYQLYAYFNNGDEVDVDIPDLSPFALPEDLQGPDRKGSSGKPASIRAIKHRTGDPRKTHVLRRGEFKQPLDEVGTGTLSALPPVRPREGDTETDRLDLARWLVSGDNPLVPRVAANHVWKQLFGEGIVPTLSDFGVRGDAPSHTRLLDHLALELVQAGWSRKALVKHIVMSATYQQSSRHRPELRASDPNNRLLYRQNRFRVEAEIIRDISLAASGLLSRKVGGPSVFPPIPEGVTDLTYNSSFKWQTSEGEDRYRRGLYTYFKRTAPHPNLITFDCPDSNVTNVQRDRSNTPIGALVTLNNATFVEAAQAMAMHVLRRVESQDKERLAYALRRCIARHPSDDELDEFLQLLTTSRQWYAANPREAADLVGDHPARGIDAAENAAWIAVLRIVLNLDEFITRE